MRQTRMSSRRFQRSCLARSGARPIGVLYLGSLCYALNFAPLRWLWLALGDLLHALWLFIAMLLCMMMAAVNVLWWQNQTN